MFEFVVKLTFGGLGFMGMTISEKILASHSGKKKVEPGDIVNARIDRVMVHEMLGNQPWK